MRCLLVLPHGVVNHTTPHSRATLATAGTCVIRQVARPRLSYVLVCVSCAPCLATDARLSWQADHDSEVNALDFNPFNEFLLVTCSGHVRSFTCSGALFCVGIVDVRCVLCSRRFTCGILAKPRRRCTRSRATQMRCSKRSGPPSTKRFAFTTTQGTGTIPSLTVCACCVHVVCVCVCVCVRTDPGIERIRPPCQRVGYRQDRCRAERRGR